MKIVVDRTLNDMTQKYVILGMVQNVCQYLQGFEIHDQILSLEHGQLNEEDCQQLLEMNSADMMRINDLLADQASVQETIKILKSAVF